MNRERPRSGGLRLEESVITRWRRERSERLAGALVRMTRDLAEARHQIMTLKRENAFLRSQLERAGRSPGRRPVSGPTGKAGGL